MYQQLRTGSRMLAVFLVLMLVNAGQAQDPMRLELREQGWIENWWSWVHWWEVNQQAVLEPGMAAAASEPLRNQATEVLLEVTASRHADHVAEAALALGRLQSPRAMPRLMGLTGHGSANVRRSAWLGLGLSSQPAAVRHFLADDRPFTFNSNDDLCAWIVGVGLLVDPPDELLLRLHRVMTTANLPDAQRLAAWAIRIHNPPGAVGLMLELLHQSEDPELVSEAILTIGQNAPEDHEQLLAGIYLKSGPGNQLPALMRLRRLRRPQPGIGVVGYAHLITGIHVAGAIALKHYQVPEDEPSLARQYLRNSFAPGPQRVREDGRSLPSLPYPFVDAGWWLRDGALDRARHAEVRFGLLSLGQIGWAADLELFEEVMGMRHTRQWSLRQHEYRYDPNRAMAALATGLLLPRLQARLADAPRHEHQQIVQASLRAVQMLNHHMQDRREPMHFRAACALALGLSRHEHAADMLFEMLEQVGPDDALLAGHAVLGLGILGQRDVLHYAGDWGWQSGEQMVRPDQLVRGTDREMTLARRAAVTGLGLLGLPEAGPVLLAAYGEDYFVSRAAVRSLKWSGHFEPLAVSLMGQLRSLEGDVADQLAIWSLGELLEPGPRSRLGRLLQDVNLTLPNYKQVHTQGMDRGFDQRIRRDQVYRYRAMASEFMHRRLLFGHGDAWH